MCPTGTRIFGLETEYMVLARLAGVTGAAANAQGASRILTQAGLSLKGTLMSPSGGGFLANGARLYCDCGCLVEVASGEVCTPTDAICQLQAGDRIVVELARLASDAVHHISLCKSNADYYGGTTRGFHENYHIGGRSATFPREYLLPHLASRVLYAGAGGWEISHYPAITFTLSPRTVHVRASETDASTSNRGLIHNRHEPLGNGYRFHILCGENQCSHRAMHLRIGATALVFALLEQGLLPDTAVLLVAPHLAIRRFARDPGLRARARNRAGRLMTALEIQRVYCAQARRNLAVLPPWAPETVEMWEHELDSLERFGAEGDACLRLDWAIKCQLYTERVRARGFESLLAFTHAGRRLAIRLRRSPTPVSGLEEADRLLRQMPGGPGYLELRAELLDIDTRYALLREPDGIFLALDRAGVLQHSAPGVTEGAIRRAMTVPPRGTRARRRGAAIRVLTRFPREGAAPPQVTWTSIVDPGRRRILELPDPVWKRVRWRDEQTVRRGTTAQEHTDDVLEWLMRQRHTIPIEATTHSEHAE